MKRMTLLSICLAADVIAAPALAQDTSVAGTWNTTLETPQGTSTPTLVLEQSGERLSGTYTGRMGEVPVTGTIKGTAVAFSVKVNAPGREFELAFSGTADGDEMKGTVAFGGMGSAKWSAARKK